MGSNSLTGVDFGPEYPKINSIFERDDRGIILPGRYSTPEISLLAMCVWNWHEKVDGTNIRLYWNGKYVTIGGRTNGDSQVNAVLMHHLMHETSLTDPAQWRKAFPDCDDVTIYGEGYGKGIRAGHRYMDTQGFIVFDVRVGRWYLTDDNIQDVSAKFGCSVVPLYGTFSLVRAWEFLKEGTLKSKWENAEIEGLVGRPRVDLYNRRGERIIAKMKLRDWSSYLRAQEHDALQAKKDTEKEERRKAYEAKKRANGENPS